MAEKMQITEQNKYSTGDIAKWIRQTLKEKFPDIKFSIRTEYYSMGSSIHATLKESKTLRFIKRFDEITESDIFHIAHARNESEEKTNQWIKSELESKHFQINKYNIDADHNLTDQGKSVLKEILKILDKYNYDNSDAQTDYFDVNYYLHFNLGEYDKPFIDGVN